MALNERQENVYNIPFCDNLFNTIVDSFNNLFYCCNIIVETYNTREQGSGQGLAPATLKTKGKYYDLGTSYSKLTTSLINVSFKF